MPALIANARMYGVAPGAVAAWRALFTEASARASVKFEIIDHVFPAKLSDLWAREDLGAAFVCGWPFVREGSVKQVIAAPVPAADWAEGKPLYRSDFIARAGSGFSKLEDSFGSRLAYTIEDSHSGYNAPRRHLLAWRLSRARPLFREVLGPYTTPRRVIEAIARGEADIGAVDSFCYALLQEHDPELCAGTMAVAHTPATRMPALMASRGIAADQVEQLRTAFLSFDISADSALLNPLCIKGFARIDPEDYAIMEEWSREAGLSGVTAIA